MPRLSGIGEARRVTSTDLDSMSVRSGSSGADVLTAPLGVVRETAPRRISPALVRGAKLGGVGLAGVTALYLLLAADPQGGQPKASASIERAPPAVSVAATADAAPAQVMKAPEKSRATAAELEAESGVKVVRQGGGAAPAALVLRVPDAPQMGKLTPAPDRRLIEKSRHGLVPKIGADGAKPSEVYARPAPARSGRPRIAIVVGGLGVGQTMTADAIAKLPAAVTLAFAPYGSELDRQAARAREEGHELLLQAPMEPFDYPDNDPGPQTLLTSLAPDQNVDRLLWLMSRFPGFIGVTNYMGAKLTANDVAIGAVLKELAARGLSYVDDGASARSVAPDLAGVIGLSAGKADIVLDAQPRGVDIDAALSRLEVAARSKGAAIGSASALPMTVERLTRWARTLDAKGIDLVPVSALLSVGRRPS